ncbi:SDR family NAD(P)-dependent oxidoreductase [Amycolatopsis sp. cmx-11-12]|uniref:SDR family NAD(P)-dependent oxidoreductase n=1 Tax=Amycolatopsis sp. cmx-11-12 TaxID=2785795 RepID=UPI003917E3A6
MNDGNLGVVFVSGASSGFGMRTTELLAGSGYRVVAAARRRDRLEDLCARNPALAVCPLEVDVRDREGLARSIHRLPADFRDVSAVINNAGLSKGFEPVQSGVWGNWHEMIETNVVGLLNVTELLLPRLVERGSGHVVNIGSIAGNYPYLGGNVYAATKAFVHQLTLNMRADLHGTGVRVSCIAPGKAETEFALVRHDGDHERARETYRGITPLDADDVAEAVAWCLSRPPRVNINMIEIMPTDQPFGLSFAPPRTEPAGTGKGTHL